MPVARRRDPAYRGLMVCLAGWGLALVVVGAVVFGWALCFFWQWWLLSRPGARPRP